MAAGGHSGLCHGLQVGCKKTQHFSIANCSRGSLLFGKKSTCNTCQNGSAIWIQRLNQFFRELTCFSMKHLFFAVAIFFGTEILEESHLFIKRRVRNFPPQIKEQQQTTIPPQNLSLTLPKTFCDFCYFWKFQSYQAARLRQSARSRRVAMELLRVGLVRWHVWKSGHKYLNQYVVYVVNPRNFRC